MESSPTSLVRKTTVADGRLNHRKLSKAAMLATMATWLKCRSFLLELGRSWSGHHIHHHGTGDRRVGCDHSGSLGTYSEVSFRISSLVCYQNGRSRASFRDITKPLTGLIVFPNYWSELFPSDDPSHSFPSKRHSEPDSFQYLTGMDSRC